MSMISEQIEKLQLLSAELKDNLEYWHVISEGEAHNWQRAVDSAITIINEPSAKVASESMERSSRYYNGGWIPCSEKMPDNGKGEICPRYLVNTEYGVTVGWYNPDFGKWFILLWSLIPDDINHIDFNGGDKPMVLGLDKKTSL